VTFRRLLAENRNYRTVWFGQVVSEIGDHFNNIAVFSLALKHGDAGVVLAGVLIARGVPMLVAGPVSGVLLDRWDRKRVMIASDLVRAAIALCFMLCIGQKDPWLLYLLSAILMFASPFFNSGRSAILPRIASAEELHTANSVTITTQWTNTAVGALLGGLAVDGFGYELSFFANAMSFLFSAWCISRLRGKFTVERSAERPHPWHDYLDGLRYIKRNPLLLAIALVGVGWALGGGAAQILFSLFGEKVFHRGASGIGLLWFGAGIGLVTGGMFAHWLGPRLSFAWYKRTVSLSYLVHGGAYVVFSQMENFFAAMFFVGLSRAAVAVSSVLNQSLLLRQVADEYRGRVFSTIDTLVWSTMMLSLMGAGLASRHTGPRTIALWAGVLSSSTALFWAWANWRGRLPECPVSNTSVAHEGSLEPKP
jgi:predicted MFS family arabinose efflux permease